MLHLPRSDRYPGYLGNVTTCAPRGELQMQDEAPQIHFDKAVHAAERISQLVRMRVRQTVHTHFFACVVVLASVVSLSSWTLLSNEEIGTSVKIQLRLCTGALKQLGDLWPIAQTALLQVQGVAQEISSSRKAASQVEEQNGFDNIRRRAAIGEDATDDMSFDFLEKNWS